MNPDERLMLLAWPRSGSSSLWQILRAHPDLDLLPDEPLNESFADWSPGNPGPGHLWPARLMAMTLTCGYSGSSTLSASLVRACSATACSLAYCNGRIPGVNQIKLSSRLGSSLWPAAV